MANVVGEPIKSFKLGRWTLVSRIGEGGMGVVHLGRDAHGVQAAVKVLRPHIVGDTEARSRLAREVSSLARIRSPRVAEIIDADTSGAIPFVATRFVDGPNLHDFIVEHGPLDAARLDRFAGELVEALAAVHGVGVLHRDIKPTNVLMQGDDPVLIDFGLARVADDPKLTHTGWLLGTPGYLPPEVLYGDDPTPASDIHALGATVAFAGMGRAPFGRGPAAAIMDRVRRGEYDLTGLPDELRPMVEECLDPDPAARPTLGELQQWFGSEVTPARFAEHADPTAEYTTFGTVPPPPVGYIPADPWNEHPAQQPLTLADRLRRAAVLMALGVTTAALATLAPYLTIVVILVAAWALRSISLTSAATRYRKAARGGARWWDPVIAVLSSPWHMLSALPGEFLLAAWAAAIASGAAVLAYGFSLALHPAIAVVGAAFAVGHWWGPGASRVRAPVGWLMGSLTRRTRPTSVIAGVLLVTALGLGLAADVGGTHWWPATGAPAGDGHRNP